jgi:hypothetical protein
MGRGLMKTGMVRVRAFSIVHFRCCTGYKENERSLAKNVGIDCICANTLNQYFVPIMAQYVFRYGVAGLTWFPVCELARLSIYFTILVTSYRLNGLVV